MSPATLLKSVTFRPAVNIQPRQVAQKRVGRSHLNVHAVTNWQLEPKKGNAKGQFIDLTESIADKATASVKSGGGDFELKGLEGLDLVFRSEGAGQKADSPADLFIKDVGSQAEICLDGKALEKNKEYKISVGQELKIGDDALFQIIRDTRAHA